MGSAKEVVVRKPGEQSNLWHSLLANNEYDQVTYCVDEAYAQAVAAGESQRATLLAAARQLCASCAQIQNEVTFHEQAYQHSETRRDKLDAELNKLLGMMEVVPETAVASQPPSIWQRVNRFLHRDSPQFNKISERDPVVVSEAWDMAEPETAVPSPAQLVQLAPEPVSPDPPKSEPTIPEPDELEPAVPELVSPRLANPAPTNPHTNLSCPRLTIYCLGHFRVFEDDHPMEEWSSRKGKSIFKYLLLHRQNRITKEVLMAQFWPESTADAARNNLNVAIYGLRQALRNGYPEFSHVLFQDDCYFLNPEMAIWVDIEAFEDAYRRVIQMKGKVETAVFLQECHIAETLYQGELFAEDRYEDWPSARRQQLQSNYLQLLVCLSEHYFASEQYAACITFANKLLQVEPCSEATHRLLMQAYCRQGQGYLALRQYHHCIELLAEELAVPPDPTTTQLYEAIRAHQRI